MSSISVTHEVNLNWTKEREEEEREEENKEEENIQKWKKSKRFKTDELELWKGFLETT